MSSVAAVTSAPPAPLPTNPTPDDVAANHAAFQQSLLQTYADAAQSASSNTSSNTNNLPPTQVLGDDPNHAFQASLVDTFLNASTSPTPNPLGTTLPGLSLDSYGSQPNPLAPAGVGTTISAVQ